MSNQFIVQTQLGLVEVSVAHGRLTGLHYRSHGVPAEHISDPLGRELVAQLGAYLEDGKREFSLPLLFSGTDFQKRVWRALCRIRPGEVRTYGDLALELQSSPRAVGNACRRNPISIVAPCHRVVAAQGIGGYSGSRSGEMLETKRWLLHHEGVSL